MSKMVTIIVFTQCNTYFIICHSTSICKFRKFNLQIIMQFLITDSTYIYILIPHGDIVEIIQIAEYTNLTKLRYTCQHGKFNIAIHRLHHTVEGFQCIPVFFLQLISTNGLQHRFVILVDKNHHPLPCFFCGQSN